MKSLIVLEFRSQRIAVYGDACSQRWLWLQHCSWEASSRTPKFERRVGRQSSKDQLFESRIRRRGSKFGFSEARLEAKLRNWKLERRGGRQNSFGDELLKFRLSRGAFGSEAPKFCIWGEARKFRFFRTARRGKTPKDTPDDCVNIIQTSYVSGNCVRPEALASYATHRSNHFPTLTVCAMATALNTGTVAQTPRTSTGRDKEQRFLNFGAQAWSNLVFAAMCSLLSTSKIVVHLIGTTSKRVKNAKVSQTKIRTHILLHRSQIPLRTSPMAMLTARTVTKRLRYHRSGHIGSWH